jgi:hypothetical protein
VKRNLTVQLDEVTIQRARVLAAQRATSISALVAAEIERLVEEADGYDRAKAAALAQLRRGFHLGGGPIPGREERHAR